MKFSCSLLQVGIFRFGRRVKLPFQTVAVVSHSQTPPPCSPQVAVRSARTTRVRRAGTALLHHGSYIKLGCLQFVFSITEFASKQPKEDQQRELNLKNWEAPKLQAHSP
uniref:Uncharacterized protein n=1 Tax=Mola mola TaxID=94237 RepID=A0A3Q3WDE5_MOLML